MAADNDAMNQLFDLDAGKPHVRFDERGLEPELRLLRQPSTLLKAFGGQHTAAAKGAQQIPMARASELYDVGTGLTWNALVEPYWVDERTLASKHIAHTPTDAIIVHD